MVAKRFTLHHLYILTAIVDTLVKQSDWWHWIASVLLNCALTNAQKPAPTFQSVSYKIKLILTLRIAFSRPTFRFFLFTLTSRSHGWCVYFGFGDTQWNTLFCLSYPGGRCGGHGAKASEKSDELGWSDRDGKGSSPFHVRGIFARFRPVFSLDSLLVHDSPLSLYKTLLPITPWKRCLCFLVACSFSFLFLRKIFFCCCW